MSRGTEVPNSHEHHCSNHCGGHCNACDDKWHYYIDVNIPSAACGGNGGDGGDGGNGGPAGLLTIFGEVKNQLSPVNTQLESAGGAAGAGGAGASGFKVNRHFDGWRCVI